MATGIILDPTSSFSHDIASVGPDVGALAGCRIGFRIDMLWRSWDWVSEVWADLLRAQGARVTFWRSMGRTGEEGARMAAEMKAFFDNVDVAVVGLANCGSCTSWTIHDALAAANRGIPAVAIATAHFEDLARALATRGGRSGLRIQILPYPLDILQKEQVHAIARDHYGSLLRTLGVRDGLAQQPAA
jgi:hypothetical protein